MSFLNHLFQVYEAYAKANPVIAGIMGIWLATSMSFIFVKFPKKVLGFIQNITSHSVTVSDANGSNYVERVAAIAAWLEVHRIKAFSKAFVLYAGDDSKLRVSAGDGAHLFVYHGRLGVAHRRESMSTNSGFSERRTVVTYRIRIYGFNKGILDAFMDDMVNGKSADSHYLDIQQVASHMGSLHYQRARMLKRDVNSVILDPDVREAIFGSLDEFVSREAWYRSRYVAYKYTMLLEGPPGTGKTSIVRAIATYLKRSRIVSMDLSQLESGQYTSLIRSITEPALIIVEDVDSSTAMLARKGMAYDPDYKGPFSDDVSDSRSSGVQLSEFLNVMDGIVSLDGHIFIISTNCIGKMDKAALREGRVDAIVHVPETSREGIAQYVKMMYHDSAEVTNAVALVEKTIDASVTMPGAKLYGAFQRNKSDPIAFVEDIHSKLSKGKNPQ